MKRKGSTGYAWTVIAVSCLVVFAALGLARFGYSIVLPSMQRGLGMDNTQAGALATADLVSYLVLSLVGGMLSARFGTRRVITTGLVCAGFGMLLTALARNAAEAAGARVLTGIGSGASNVPVMGLISAWSTRRKRGLAAGIAVAGSSIGLILLGPIVPRLIRAAGADGWRLAWTGFGALSLLIAILAAIVIRDHPSDINVLPLGGSADDPVQTPPARGSFFRVWGDIMRLPGVWRLGFTYTAFGFSYIIYMTFFVKRLVADAGYTPIAAGSVFMVMGFCSVVCGVLWGSISDRIGRARALMLIYLVHTIAFALYGASVRPGLLTLSAILFGLSAWSIPAVMAAACGDLTGPALAPATLGFITLFFGIGQATGPSVAGALTDRTGSLAAALFLAAGAALLGAIGAARLHTLAAVTTEKHHAGPQDH